MKESTATKKTEKKEVLHRQFEGIVLRAPKQKTIAVRVARLKEHPKYRKQYGVSRTFQVHDEKNEAAVGDAVVFEECRPLSKTKRWRLRTIVSKNTQA